jgi:hypothetical protein
VQAQQTRKVGQQLFFKAAWFTSNYQTGAGKTPEYTREKNRSNCWRVMEKSLHGLHPLFVDQSPNIREYLKTQIDNKYNLFTSKMESSQSSTSPRELPL